MDYLKSWKKQEIAEVYECFHKARLALLLGTATIYIDDLKSDIKIEDLNIAEVVPTYQYAVESHDKIFAFLEAEETRKREEKRQQLDEILVKLDISKISEYDLKKLQECVSHIK